MSDIAHTTLGAIQGARADGVVRFHTVPYATPPLGVLRFAPPQPQAAWTGIKDATVQGPIAPQPKSRLSLAMGDFTRAQSEDCLTLAIATPAADGGKRPVIVWLHGGAFLSGAGSLDWYDGGTLAGHGDVVVVGVNYRLGPMGFFYAPGIGDGLAGIHDMIAALRFVQAHIAAFGGDPANVTIMGQSAGAIAILRMLDMPATSGLFHRAIVQSGLPRIGQDAATAVKRAHRLMELLGIDPGAADAKARLQAAPAEQLVTLQMQIARENARFGSIEPAFPPVFDGTDDTGAFSDRIAAACAARGIDVMLGYTREEMLAFFVADPNMANPDPAAVATYFTTLTGTADSMKSYRKRRPGADLRDLLGDLITDHRFIFPAIGLCERLHAANRAAFLYEFSWAPAASPWRACHCIELPFVFGNRAAWDAPMLAGMREQAFQGLSQTMMTAWTDFARDGKPGLGWTQYDPEHRRIMRFGATIGLDGDFSAVRRRDAVAG